MLDCIVIGAGAAGIGAGLALLRQKHRFVILEAKDRIGGRAFTNTTALGVQWDEGCHWFHSASVNPLRKLARKLNHPFTDQAVRYDRHRWQNGSFGNLSDVDADDEALGKRFIDVDRSGADIPLSTLLDHGRPSYDMLRHGLALNWSHEPEDISVFDGLTYQETHENVPVSGGYGALVARLARGLPVSLNTAVSAIDVLPDRVRVLTVRGTLEAASVIVAVSARVMERHLIRFTPQLPANLLTAFEKITLGWFEKVAFSFDTGILAHLGEGGVEAVATLDGAPWPVFFQLNDNNQPLAIAHVAGNRARDLSERDRIQLCEDALLQIFGNSVRRHIMGRATSRWRDDPWIGGAYSGAKPGYADLRKLFSEPVHDRVHFAGEHTSLDAMTTAHGAYMSGQHAAMRTMGLGADAADPLWLPEGA